MNLIAVNGKSGEEMTRNVKLLAKSELVYVRIIFLEKENSVEKFKLQKLFLILLLN